MELCEDALDLITFGDVVAFIKPLMKSHADIVDNALDGTPTYALHLNERLKTQPEPVIVSPDDCGELLAGGHCLSERAYKNTRRILQSKNVHLATYYAAMACLKSLDVGTPVSTGEGNHTECSQCFTWQLKDTLQRVVQVEELFSHFHFPSEQQQQNLFHQLQQRRPDLYKNLDTTRRSIFLRQTGDNYRAALKRQPTQQMSFCTLNLQSLVNSPLGQFVVSSLRGDENRSLLRTHMAANFREVEEMAREGITEVAGAEAVESFNVVLYVFDFSHSKEVLGRVQVTAEQGYCQCDWPASTRHKPQQTGHTSNLGKPRDFKELAYIGRQAEQTLGVDPDKHSREYTEGPRWTDRATVAGLPVPRNMPAVRTSFASGIASVPLEKDCSSGKRSRPRRPSSRGTESDWLHISSLPSGTVFIFKEKSYDGSDTLKMTGVDCIRLEEQVEKFVEFFLRPGQTMSDVSCLGLRNLVELFTLTRKITKEMRALTTTTDRIENVEKILQKIKDDCPAECSSS